MPDSLLAVRHCSDKNMFSAIYAQSATTTTAASGGNREELLGQRPARRECRPRHDADAGCRNPEDTVRISNLLPPAVLDGGICLLVQQLHKQLLLRLQGFPLRVHQHVPHLLLLRRAAVQRQMVLLQRAAKNIVSCTSVWQQAL